MLVQPVQVVFDLISWRWLRRLQLPPAAQELLVAAIDVAVEAVDVAVDACAVRGPPENCIVLLNSNFP